MSVSKIWLFVFVLGIVISCKKEQTDKIPEITEDAKEEVTNSFTQLSGDYIGNLRHHGTYHTTDFEGYDSITGEPIGNLIVIDTEVVDTMYEKTVSVEVIKDTILFYVATNSIYDFLVNKENEYAKHFPGYTSTTFSINGDTLYIFDTYVLNRGSDYASVVTNNFMGIKEE